MEKNLISIIAQAFYGNKTGTNIHRDDIDRFILGYLDDDVPTEPIDRTIVHLPGSENIVLVYNKYAEAERLADKEVALAEDTYTIPPLASIPELGIEIYSRCIICRMNIAGELESIQNEDYAVWNRYLAD